MTSKTTQKYANAIVIALIPFIILLTALASVGFNDQFFTKLVQRDSQNPEQALPVTLQLLDYFAGSAAMPNVFQGKEKTHLIDVKKVIQGWTIAYFLMLIVFISLLPFANLKKAFLLGSLATILLLFLIEVVPFALSFTAMHNVFFEPGTWQFPANSLLIRYYPETFFANIVSTVFYRSLALVAAFLFLSMSRTTSHRHVA